MTACEWGAVDSLVAGRGDPAGSACCIHGLYVTGAQWDPVRRCLTDPGPRDAYAPLPVVIVRAEPRADPARPDDNSVARPPAALASKPVLDCPVFFTRDRAPGHFVASLPLAADPPLRKWVLLGVGLVLST